MKLFKKFQRIKLIYYLSIKPLKVYCIIGYTKEVNNEKEQKRTHSFAKFLGYFF